MENKTRTKSAHKTHLIFNHEDLSVEVDVKFEKMTAKDIKAENQVIKKDLNGNPLTLKSYFKNQEIQKGDYRKVYINDKGAKVPVEEIRNFQIINGKEEEVSPFARTTNLEIIKVEPKEIKNDFLAEDVFEVWSENQAGLFKIADYLDKTDQVALASIVLTSGHFTQYLAIIEPVFEETRFILSMTTCLKHKDYTHWLNIEEAKQKQPERPQIKARAKTLEIINTL